MVAPVFRSLLMGKRSVIPPEPDIYPYLLTRRNPQHVKLMASSTDALYYTNTYPKTLIIDELSNKLVEDRYLYITFSFIPKTTNNYTVLFEVPDVIRFSYNWQEGWGLIIELEQVGKFYIKTSDIPTEGCTVSLLRQDNNSDIVLRINNSITYTLFKRKSSWTQPILTSNTSYGEVTSSANRSSSATQAEWHALDGLKPNPNDQYTYFGWNVGINYFWQWKLPINIEITGLSLYNRATTGTTNYSRTIQFYADEAQEINIGDTVTLAQDSTTLSTVQNITPVTTNTIRAYLLDTYNGTSGYGGIGELYITANQINTQPSYDAGQLVMYDKTSFHSLELYGQEPPYFNIIWNMNNIEVPLNQVTSIGFTVETNVTDHYDIYFSYNSQDREIYGNSELHSDRLILLPEAIGEANSGYLRIEYRGQTYTSDTLHINIVAEDQIAILLSPSSTIIKSLEFATVDIVSNSVPNPISINYAVSGNTEAFAVTPNFSQDYTGSIQVTSNTEEGGQVTVCVWVQNESGNWYMSNYATVVATPTGQLEYCNIVVTPTEQTVYIGDWAYYNISIDTNIEPAPTISDLTLLLESGDSNVGYELIGSNQLGLFPRTVNSSSTVFFRYTSGTGLIYNSNSFIVNCIPFELSGDEYLNVIFEPNDITLKVGESVDVNMTIQTNLEKLPSLYFGSTNWDTFSYNKSGDTITITGVQPGQAQFVGSMNITVEENIPRPTTDSNGNYVYAYYLTPRSGAERYGGLVYSYLPRTLIQSMLRTNFLYTILPFAKTVQDLETNTYLPIAFYRNLGASIVEVNEEGHDISGTSYNIKYYAGPEILPSVSGVKKLSTDYSYCPDNHVTSTDTLYVDKDYKYEDSDWAIHYGCLHKKNGFYFVYLDEQGTSPIDIVGPSTNYLANQLVHNRNEYDIAYCSNAPIVVFGAQIDLDRYKDSSGAVLYLDEHSHTESVVNYGVETILNNYVPESGYSLELLPELSWIGKPNDSDYLYVYATNKTEISDRFHNYIKWDLQSFSPVYDLSNNLIGYAIRVSEPDPSYSEYEPYVYHVVDSINSYDFLSGTIYGFYEKEVER